MAGARRGILLLVVLLVGALVAYDPAGRPAIGVDADHALARGEDYARRLIVEGRNGSLSAEGTIALGYLERLRLGLGSPFRLVDYALRDPRLSDATGARLAWALLGRTRDGRAYAIPPQALEGIGGVGRAHLKLIEGAITEAPDPRGGELAVRLAYTLAAAEDQVGGGATRPVTEAAALIRDRELARRDVRHLLRAARAEGTDPLRLLRTWREQRRFAVEHPPMAALPGSVEQRAIEQAPRLAQAIRSLPTTDDVDRTRAGTARTLLGPAAASRLALLADSLDAPPQTPIVVSLDIHRRTLTASAGRAPGERIVRERMLRRATNEERFIAEHALATRWDAAADPDLARVALRAAAALRTYAQEEVWFPGSGGPTTRELTRRYGLASIRFDRGIPAAWRPYYRRMLERALSDMQRVLPSLRLRGLRIRFGDARRRTLAVHDPDQRVIHMPPATSAGTIAHEIAHDLDWQVSVSRYGVRGDYGSDRAMRRGGGRLASALDRLTAAPLTPPRPGDLTPPVHAQRPAEVFARSVDWFVAVSLAAQGRTNGYLSSVQDDVLTGYGTVRPPDVTGEAGAALVTILDEVAPVYPATRRWFLEKYGPGRALTPYDLVRRVLEERGTLPVRAALSARFEAVKADRDAALEAIDAWVCRAPGAAYDAELERARRRLVVRAAVARARGIVLDHARIVAGREGRRWVADRLFDVPSGPGGAVMPDGAERLRALASRARAVGDAIRSPRRDGLRLAATPPRCGAAPFSIG